MNVCRVNFASRRRVLPIGDRRESHMESLAANGVPLTVLVGDGLRNGELVVLAPAKKAYRMHLTVFG